MCAKENVEERLNDSSGRGWVEYAAGITDTINVWVRIRYEAPRSEGMASGRWKASLHPGDRRQLGFGNCHTRRQDSYGCVEDKGRVNVDLRVRA